MKIIQKILSGLKYVFFAGLLIYGVPTIYIVEKEFYLSRGLVALLAIWFFLVVFLFISGNSYICNSKWCGGISSVLMIELFGMLLFAQHHYKTAVALGCVAVFSFITMAVIMLVGTAHKKQEDGRIYKILSFSKAFAIIFSAGLFAVPSFIGLNNESIALENKWDRYSKDYVINHSLLEETDPIDRHEEIIKKLSQWESISHEERVQALYGVAAIEMEVLGFESLDSVDVYVDKLPALTAGTYRDGEKSIIINVIHIGDDTVKENVFTVIHEVFHAYQYHLINSLDFQSDAVKNGYYYEQAREWKHNTDNYIKFEISMEAYKEQPLERDANRYAKHRIDAYTNRIQLYKEGV